MINFYCGEWDFVPKEIKKSVEVKAWTTETQKQMYEYGSSLAHLGLDRDISIFTNNDHILDAIRMSVKNFGHKRPPSIRIIYFDGINPAGHEIRMDYTGTLSEWPPGFFDESEKFLANILARS